jgi:hypothetical protein
MLSPDRPRRPFGALLAREVSNVGLAVRREFALVAGGLAFTLLLVSVTAIRYHEKLALLPELMFPGLLVALLLPWLVWKGDPPFGHAYLWTLPVRRQQAAAAKIAAGAFWLMLAMLLAFAMLTASALATGGAIGLTEVRLVGPFSGGLAAATPTPWSTPLWMWVVPFGGALTAYVASSALFLGLRYPVRVVAAVAVMAALLTVLAVNLGPDTALYDGLGRFAETIAKGRWGLDFAITGGVASLSEELDLPGPGSRDLWVALPTAGRWAAALLVWFGAALVALALALRRHWER